MSGERILIVDDMAANRRTLRRCLERDGLRCDSAADGVLALAMLAQAEYDAMILDLHMPLKDGEDVLREVRRRTNGLALPILIATAEDDPAMMIRLIDQGANDYLVKPVEPGVLVARLRSALRFRAEARRAAESAPTAAHSERIGLGTVLGGRYRMGPQIGSGGFGTVYHAIALADERPVAVKVLHRAHLASPTVRRRFELECLIASDLHHPNAVELIAFDSTHEDTPYLVMELLSGHGLIDEVEELPPFQPVAPKRLAEIMVPVCNVLESVHARGILHRDIKLENIFLHQTRQGEVVKVLDFGVAKLMQMHETLTGTNELVGTLQYMAPEQLSGDDTDHRVDVYAVGVVVYAMLAREFPYPRAESPLALASTKLNTEPRALATGPGGVDPDLAAVLMRALSRRPEDRPRLAEIREALLLHAVASTEPTLQDV